MKKCWPQLVHLDTERVFPLRMNGATTFGRAPRFFNYQDRGISRWSDDDAARLNAAHYVSLSDNTLVSRTHGVIIQNSNGDDLIYQDLNSANGSLVNFRQVNIDATSRQLAQIYDLPDHFATFRLTHGDVLTIGEESFAIEFLEDPIYELQRRRTALFIEGLAGHVDERFQGLEKVLIDRGFTAERILKTQLHSSTTVDDYDDALRKLSQPGFVHSEGATLIVITCQIKARKLMVNGEVVDLAGNFFRYFDRIPGAKVIALITPDQCQDFHKTLFSHGFRDTVLISEPSLIGPATDTSAESEAPIFLAFRRLFDTMSPMLQIDKLNEIKHPDMEVTIGQHEREEGSYGGVIQSLDLDLGSSFSSSLRRSF